MTLNPLSCKHIKCTVPRWDARAKLSYIRCLDCGAMCYINVKTYELLGEWFVEPAEATPK